MTGSLLGNQVELRHQISVVLVQTRGTPTRKAPLWARFRILAERANG